MGLQEKLPSKLRSPVVLAVILTVLLVIWLAIGDKKEAKTEGPPIKQESTSLNQVEFRWSQAKEQVHEVVVQGQMLPWQQVAIKAQVTGQVMEILSPQGTAVEANQAVLELSDEGRTERLQEARAAIKLRQSELNSAKTLQKSSFTSETELTRLTSALAQSKADLVAAELAVKHSRPVAPFEGVVDRRYVELGEWVSPGTQLMDIVDIAQLKVTADIPQQQVARLQEGQAAQVELLDGRQLQAHVSFISFSANPQTRSFYIELKTDNPQRWRVAGSSATVRINLPPVMAHSLSPALLNLDKNGNLGVYAVDEQNTVQFYPVKLVRVDNEAAIVEGIPERLRVITLGAGFVSPGDSVKAVEAD